MIESNWRDRGSECIPKSNSTRFRLTHESYAGPFGDPDEEPCSQQRSDAFASALCGALREELSIRDLRALLTVFHTELLDRERGQHAYSVPGTPVCRRTAHEAAFVQGGDATARIFIDERQTSLEALAARLEQSAGSDEDAEYRAFAETIVQSLAPHMSLTHLEYLIAAAQREHDDQEQLRQAAIAKHKATAAGPRT